ncbi:MAG: glycosyltransferase family 2 protein [Candidatus Competibacterales bacterium]
MKNFDEESVSIVIPAKNEVESLKTLCPKLRSAFPNWQIVLVDDGSTDETATIARQHNIQVVSHPYSMGNGAAIKSGVRAAERKTVICMDADGQHQVEDIKKLVDKMREGYDMVVGSRRKEAQANIARAFANGFYNKFSSVISDHDIKDLTSGFRALDREKFAEFLYLLPNGFSYPTTITMAFLRSGYSVEYVSIDVKKRIGKSHIKPLRDGFRFIMIIFKIGSLFSPLKIFVPFSLMFFFLGMGHYLVNYVTVGRFTNMSALLFITSIVVFLIGLLSEQITSLTYKK